MEVEIAIIGVAGQGIQLMGQTLALAATAEGKHAMLTSDFGGGMRGGHSLAFAVVGDAPLSGLPVVSQVRSAVAVSAMGWDIVRPRLLPNALIVTNSSLFGEEIPSDSPNVYEIPASDIATQVASTMSTGLVLLGAYVTISCLVDIESLVQAAAGLLPPYRQQFLEQNSAALRAGAEYAKDIPAVPLLRARADA